MQADKIKSKARLELIQLSGGNFVVICELSM